MMKVLHRVISLVMIIFFAVLPKTAFANQCDVPCSITSYDDPTCYNAEGSCTWCSASYHVCTQPNSGNRCTKDATCWGADKHTWCDPHYDPGYGTIGGCGMPSCGTPCTDDRTCRGAADTDKCTKCIDYHCSQPYPDPPSCISDANGLFNAAIGSNDQITLCSNSEIMLSSTILINRNGQDITLYCSGSCSIVGNDEFPLMVINANTVTIIGITFQNGKSNDNGGAISLTANFATVESCTFISNTALFKGGAIYLNGPGEISNCQGSNNQATQCSDVFLSSNGVCCVLGLSCS